jgi:hypothetical protein
LRSPPSCRAELPRYGCGRPCPLSPPTDTTSTGTPSSVSSSPVMWSRSKQRAARLELHERCRSSVSPHLARPSRRPTPTGPGDGGPPRRSRLDSLRQDLDAHAYRAANAAPCSPRVHWHPTGVIEPARCSPARCHQARSTP